MKKTCFLCAINKFQIALTLLSFSIVTFKVLGKTELVFAVNPSSTAQQEIYHILARDFELIHPDIEVNVASRLLENHKTETTKFQRTGQAFGDVIMGYAGNNMRTLFKQGLVYDLSQFWQEQKLNKVFSANSKRVVSVDDKVFAIPLNYYQWGMYYKKNIFKNLSLTAPQNWHKLLELVAVLRKNDIVPFSLSGQSNWTLAAWFDYLNLRINGLEYHLMLLSGKTSFIDPKVVAIFSHWQQLIQASAFDGRHLDLTWQQSLPLLYRDYVAIALMGNFFVAHIPDGTKEQFGFFAFPQIVNSMPRYEDAPFDVAFIAKSTKVLEAALKFLTYLSQAETQTKFSNYIGKISPHLLASTADRLFIKEGKQHIENAAGVVQFFDRETPEAFSPEAQQVFHDFIENPNSIEGVINELEQLRVKYLAPQL